MRRSTSFRRGSRARRGLALIMVLAFIALASILIVSFISFTRLNRLSTAGYSKSIQVQEIAQGGLQDVLGDLHREIIAGSYTNSTVFAPQGTNMVFVPTNNFTVVPARMGYAANCWGNSYNSPAQGNLSPSLIRVSRASQDGTATHFYPALNAAYYDGTLVQNLRNRASPSNTATPSLNGRFISPARWNKTLLLGPTFLTNTAFPYEIPEAFATNTPDWVYVTRAGSRACANTSSELTVLKGSSGLNNNYYGATPLASGVNPPASPVVGRYAFVMYDEGALLDANISGYINSATNAASAYTDSTTGNIQTVNGKSYLAHADLTQLPGLTGAMINNLVAWRNGSASLTSASNPGSANLQAIFNYAKGGFLKYVAGDSPLLGRQDLINYFNNIDSGFNTSTPTFSQALPYLGTFTRALNAPTWSPSVNSQNMTGYLAGSGTSVAYRDNAETTGNANRDLPNVRFAQGGTVVHYNDDASTTSYSVSLGDSLLQGRFSLARIGWLSKADPTTGDAPSSTYASAIKSCFGLVWGSAGSTATNSTHSTSIANGGNPCWTYAGSTGATLPSSIETLDQVAAEGREPNFFELLKAAILSGSVGISPGPAGFVNGTVTSSGYDGKGGGVKNQQGPAGLVSYTLGPSTSASPRAPSQVADIQIIQIGANIIDQYDADSYPTAIYFRYLTGSTELAYDPVIGSRLNPGLYGPVDMVYGNENLPYLTRMLQLTCSPTGGGNGTGMDSAYWTTTEMASWYQPELWNPHQQPGKIPSGLPHNFQIRAYGAAQCFWANTTSGVGGSSSTVNYFQGTGGSAETCPVGTINFSDSGTTSSFYAHPSYLTSDQLTGVSASSPELNNVAANFPPQLPRYDLNHFVGFCSGIATDFVPAPTGGTQPSGNLKAWSKPVNGSYNTFVLGWLDGATTGAGNFHPYSFLSGVFPYDYSALTPYGYPVGTCNPQDGGSFQWSLADSRSYRFSLFCDTYPGSTAPPNQVGSRRTPTPGESFVPNGSTLFPKTGYRYGVSDYMPVGPGFFPTPGTLSSTGFPSDWAVNSATANTTAGQVASSFVTYYADPDGVVRPGDGIYGNTASGDGMPLFTTAGTGSIATGDTSGTLVGPGDSTGNSQHGRRPIILNRPFRSVGELGYTFRDLPFKTLDFFSSSSADAALLDLFSITDEPKVVSGQFNPNNAPYPVLQAVLSYGSKKDMDVACNMTTADAKAIAQNIVSSVASSGPIVNRAGLVTQFQPFIHGNTGFSATADQANKAYFEAPVRALADVTNTRTWNLMIDVIAQAGHLSSTATSLDNFVVEGEKRYWLHVAIDRYTGKIIDQQLEPVYE